MRALRLDGIVAQAKRIVSIFNNVYTHHSLRLVVFRDAKNDMLSVIHSVINLGYIYGKVRTVISIIAPGDQGH